MRNTKQAAPTTRVTVKGQVTLPKAVRDAAGIRPGDRVVVRERAEGGVLIERARLATPDAAAVATTRKRIENALALLDRRGIRPTMSTDELMRLTRGED